MKTLFESLALFSIALSVTVSAIADDHVQIPTYGGVETFACDFNEGKDMDDLLRVTKKWDKWADKNHTVGYTGLLLTPFYYDSLDADVYWVGFSPSFEDQAIAQSEYDAKAGKLEEEFLSVYSCKSHSQLAWVRVRDDSGDTETGIVDFSACAMAPGATQEKMAIADKKMNSFLSEINSTTRIYRWYPLQGNEISEADYYQASWSASLQDKGTNADKFVQNGGIQLRRSLYDDLVQCNGGPSANFIEAGRSQE